MKHPASKRRLENQLRLSGLMAVRFVELSMDQRSCPSSVSPSTLQIAVNCCEEKAGIRSMANSVETSGQKSTHATCLPSTHSSPFTKH